MRNVRDIPNGFKVLAVVLLACLAIFATATVYVNFFSQDYAVAENADDSDPKDDSTDNLTDDPLLSDLNNDDDNEDKDDKAANNKDTDDKDSKDKALEALGIDTKDDTHDPQIDSDNLVDPTQRSDNSFIYDTTIESLLDPGSLYEDRTIQVVGEVIGDQINAEDNNCWITLSSTDSQQEDVSISVLLSRDQAKQIDHFGKYGVTGTILQVRGTYHKACKEHDGLSDIHASESVVISQGVENPDTFDISKFIPGLLVALLGCVLLIGFYLARERMR